MTRFLFFGKRYIYLIRLFSFILAVLFCLGTAGLPLYAAGSTFVYKSNSDTGMQTQTYTAKTSGTAQAPVTDPSDIMSSVDITANAALIFGTGRGMILYRNNEDSSANYPAASKLMTAVIALETQSLDTQVTISSEAETLDKKSKNPLSLSKGEKCSVKFLVTALLYMDSDAAAFSLAEYIASDEISFVNQMNETAKVLGMNSTLFANTSGKEVINSHPASANADINSSQSFQYTTISDLTSLFRYALGLNDFRDLFTKYKTLMFLSDGTPQTLTNNMSAAWGLNPQLKGAARFECDDSSSTSCVLAVAAVNDFEIAIILGGSQNDSIYQDLYKSINTTFSSYEVSDLVVSGDTYRQVSIAGIPAPLAAVFESTVRYIHPAGNDYIKPNTIFIPSETVTLPIRIGESLGQVRFELEDGTQIDTEVVAAQSMWTKSDFLSDTIALLVANRNLSVIIGIAFVFFLASVIRTVFIFIIRHARSRKHPGKSAGI